jgi:hypothetical protein
MSDKCSVEPGFDGESLLRKARLTPKVHQIRRQQGARLTNWKLFEVLVPHNSEQCPDF